jgi:hypothetical protein
VSRTPVVLTVAPERRALYLAANARTLEVDAETRTLWEHT